MAAKRAIKAVEDAKEAKANELIRRKAGKVCAHNTCAILLLNIELGYESIKRRDPSQRSTKGS